METSHAPRPQTAASPSELIDIEACSVTYAVTPPISSNEPQCGSAASHSAALAAASASPRGAAPLHSAVTAGKPPVHQPEASQSRGTAPRNINAANTCRYHDTAVRAPTTVDGGLQAQDGSGRGLNLDDTQSVSVSRENQTDSFSSRLASFTSTAISMTAAAAVGGHNTYPKSFISRNG